MNKFSPLLNPSGKAPLRKGYVQVSTERDFLQRAVTESRLMVCGSRLCQWARDFYKARGVEFETMASPENELLTLCPEMNVAWAEEMVHILGDHFKNLRRPLQMRELFTVLFPGGPWQAFPSINHAAEWLVWLADTCPSDTVLPLFSLQATEWRSADDQLSTLYIADNPQKAHDLLKVWLGLEPSRQWKSPATFPIDVPTRWLQRARDAWSKRAVNEGASLFEEILELSLPLSLTRVAAQTICDYIEANEQELTPRLLSLLCGYLDQEHSKRLEAILPPTDPDSPPVIIDEVSQWFTECYLPFRKWSLNNGNSAFQQRADEVAQKFARWCLDFYPAALAGGAGISRLAIHQGAKLRENRDEWVTLWAVIDGLNYADAALLSQWIEEEPRLFRTCHNVVFSTLPTITEFCKGALIFGTPPESAPRDSTAIPSDITALSDNKNPATALANASLGDIFLWKMSEPDTSYHKSQDRSTLIVNVMGKLKTLAERLKAATKSVNSSLPLRIVLSTDHGRLLDSSQREHAVPLGMISEGRAAHGNMTNSAWSTNASGYEINEDHVAFLGKSRFRLPEDCAVVLDGHAFQMNDGSHGSVEFPHGGLYPEEVLTPWIEFVRDAKLPQVEVQILGQGVAGALGVLKLVLKNPSNMTLRLHRLSLRFGDVETAIPIEGVIEGMTKREYEVDWPEWPDKAEAAKAVGSVSLDTLAGKRVHAQAEVSIKSSQIYTSNFDKDDLLNL